MTSADTSRSIYVQILSNDEPVVATKDGLYSCYVGLRSLDAHGRPLKSITHILVCRIRKLSRRAVTFETREGETVYQAPNSPEEFLKSVYSPFYGPDVLEGMLGVLRKPGRTIRSFFSILREDGTPYAVLDAWFRRKATAFRRAKGGDDWRPRKYAARKDPPST